MEKNKLRDIVIIVIIGIFIVDNPKVILSENNSDHHNFYANNNILPVSSVDIDFQNIEQAKELTGINSLYDEKSLTGKNITVAFIDTGIEYTHEVFKTFGDANTSKKVIGYYNAVNDSWDEATIPEDIQGHGSHVASICSGNSSRYKGIAPSSNIVMVRIFFNNGSDDLTNNTIILRALNWIKENKQKYNIKILSMSFGDGISSDGEDDISKSVDSLVNIGILPVISAGNIGYLGPSTVGIPASSKKGITVGGTDLNGYMYSKSSKGPTTDGRIKPDVVVPGEYILGADISTNNDYKYITGTSQAAPIVSGIASLLLEYNSSLDPMKIKQLISLSTRQTYGSVSYRDNYRGWGLVKANPIIDLLEHTIEILKYTNIDLNGSMKEDGIWARKIDLKKGEPYIFKMNTTDADLFIFKEEPNDYGEPILISWSGNNFNDKVAITPSTDEEFYIICKIKPGVDYLSIRIEKINFSIEYSMLWMMFLLTLSYIGVISLTLRKLVKD